MTEINGLREIAECCDKTSDNLSDLLDKLRKFIKMREEQKLAGGAADEMMLSKARDNLVKLQTMQGIIGELEGTDGAGGAVNQVKALKEAAHQMLGERLGARSAAGLGMGGSSEEQSEDEEDKK